VAQSHLSCVINILPHQARPNLARFEISTVILLGLEVFSNVTPCHWVVSRRLKEHYAFTGKGQAVHEDEGTMSLQNIRKH
jgi:hypothetical protein